MLGGSGATVTHGNVGMCMFCDFVALRTRQQQQEEEEEQSAGALLSTKLPIIISITTTTTAAAVGEAGVGGRR